MREGRREKGKELPKEDTSIDPYSIDAYVISGLEEATNNYISHLQKKIDEEVKKYNSSNSDHELKEGPTLMDVTIAGSKLNPSRSQGFFSSLTKDGRSWSVLRKVTRLLTEKAMIEELRQELSSASELKESKFTPHKESPLPLEEEGPPEEGLPRASAMIPQGYFSRSKSPTPTSTPAPRTPDKKIFGFQEKFEKWVGIIGEDRIAQSKTEEGKGKFAERVREQLTKVGYESLSVAMKKGGKS